MLPVVSAAVLISVLGEAVGLVALIIPGVLLMLRWAVVAQVAALESKSWTDALHRSDNLTDGHYAHVFGLVISVAVIGFTANLALGIAFGHTTTTAASFLGGTALRVLVSSFTALVTALLYFDLTARFREGAREVVVPEPSGDDPLVEIPSGPGDPLTPDGYTDLERPSGWYIDPEAPARMRYWGADGRSWSKRTTKTPKQTFAEWQALSENR